MHFDDRLATVLRHRAASERGAATQFRQLIDLLGAHNRPSDEKLLATAYLRLGALAENLPMATRAAILSDPATRLRNAKLVARLAEDEPAVATAALSNAKLPPADWLKLIPALPMRARGLLRHRRDLDPDVAALLAKLGVGDHVLPQPEGYEPVQEVLAPVAPEKSSAQAPKAGGIGELVERIEAYRQTRSRPVGLPGSSDPTLPLDLEERDRGKTITKFDFSLDAAGQVDWAEGAAGAAMIGHTLAGDTAAGTVGRALRRRLVVSGATLSLGMVPLLGGEWRIDAAPRFADIGGRFLGHVGRARRIDRQAANSATQQVNPQADRIRQMLHELRTPVNAIQGFAEVIQQQLFGPTPHEYRALAATIAGDAARMLAGFDELDRLARLEAGALELDEGSCDLADLLAKVTQQLSGLLAPRMSEFALQGADQPCPVPLAAQDGENMIWRLFATLAAAVSAGEVIELVIRRTAETVAVTIDLPAHMLSRNDVFGASVRNEASAVTAGMFGAGFSLRLARAECAAAGGSLERLDDTLLLTLPLLTANKADNSERLGSRG